MYSIFIMEEKAEKPTEKEAKIGEKKWHCPICGARIWSATRRGIPDPRNTTTPTMC